MERTMESVSRKLDSLVQDVGEMKRKVRELETAGGRKKNAMLTAAFALFVVGGTLLLTQDGISLKTKTAPAGGLVNRMTISKEIDPATITFSRSHLIVGEATGAVGELRFKELDANGSQYVGFKAPNLLGGNTVWTLPSADGAAGTFLVTNGGVLSFSDAIPASTALPFNQITTGTNTGAAMTVGGGASIVLSGGSIESSVFKGSGTTTDAVDLGTAEVGGTLTVGKGGTGVASLTSNGVLYGGATIGATAAGASGTVLSGTGGAPAFSASPTLTGITTTGQPAHVVKPFGGGAGQAGEIRFEEVTGAGNNYVGFKAPDDIGANKVWVLPAADGGVGEALVTNGSGVLSWTSVGGSITVKEVDGAPSIGSVTSIEFDQADGFVVSSPGAGTARVELGTVPVANGGTGQTSALTQGGVIYASSTTAMASSAAGTSGSGVLISGGSGTPTWGNSTSGSATTMWSSTTSSTTSGSIGIYGRNTAGGVAGTFYGMYAAADGAGGSGTHIGLYATSSGGATNYAIRGENTSNNGSGIHAFTSGSPTNASGAYVQNSSTAGSGTSYGVYSVVDGVAAGSTHTGIYGSATGGTTNWAGYFDSGNVNIQNNLFFNGSQVISSAGAWSGGTIAVGYGGTGLTSAAQGDIIYASAANTFLLLNKNTTATRYLSNTGASNNPAWSQVDLSNGVTGTLQIANGGTGSSSQNFVDLTTGQTAAGAKVWSNAATFNGGVAINTTGSLTTDQATFSLVNTNATTVNFAGTATTINVGASTGTTTINGNLTVAPTKNFTVGTSGGVSGTFTQGFNSSVNASADIKTIVNSSVAGTVGVKGIDITLQGTATSGANTITGINFPNVTTIANNTFNGITFGTGFNNFLTSSTINITAAGAITGATGISSSGTIAFSGLTASRFVVTDASSNLAASAASSVLANTLTDETGTGVAVFGTSPSITTSLVTGSASFDLVNTVATTVNFAGAATTLNIGASSGTATINNGTINLANGVLQTAGTQRLSNAGALSNITGYTQSSGTFSLTSTTATGNVVAMTDTSLTTGSAMNVTATNTATTNTPLRQVAYDLTNAQSTAANTSFVGMGINFTNNPSVGGNTESALRIQNQVTANVTDVAVDALLLIDNADTSASGSTVVSAAIKITNTGGVGYTNLLDTPTVDITAAGVISGLTGLLSSGTITFSGLTASRFVVTDGSSNLAASAASSVLANTLTDETGTGVAVFGTSPSITTSLVTGSASFDLVNTVATTVNFAGAATTLSIGASGGTTTVNGSLTVGDATGTDTLAFNATSGRLSLPATLGTTNGNMRFNSGTGFVEYYNGATKVLVSTDGGQTLTNKTLVDASTTFQDDVTSSKNMHFELSSLSAAVDRILTVPDSNGTLDLLEYAQTFTASKTFASNITIGDGAGTDLLAFNGTSGFLSLPTAAVATGGRIRYNAGVVVYHDGTAERTLATLETSQTFSGAKTFSGGFTVSAGSISFSEIQAGSFTFQNAASDPATTVEGRSYWKSDTNEFKIYNGAAWVTIGGSGSGILLAPTSTQSWSSADPAIWIDEAGAGTPNLIRMTVAGANAFVVANSGAVSIAASSNQFILNSNGVTGTLTWTPTGAGKTITLPDLTGTVPLGTGTTNYAAYWSGANAISAEQYLSTSRGGTGVGTFTSNGVLYGNGAGAVQVTAAGAANSVLISGGGAPSFSTSLTLGANLTVNGNTTFGDATSDTVTFTARPNSNILPSTDATRDLGSTANRWANLYLSGNVLNSSGAQMYVLRAGDTMTGTLNITGGGGGLKLGANDWEDGGATYGHVVSDDTTYKALMIVGNNIAGNSGFGREVKVWDLLNVQGRCFATTDMRAPIYYDSDNTSYYVNPATGSVLAGTVSTTGDFRAPIFYDSNNTGYYTDPASTSNINVLQCANIISQQTASDQVNAGAAETWTTLRTVTITTGSYGSKVLLSGLVTLLKTTTAYVSLHITRDGSEIIYVDATVPNNYDYTIPITWLDTPSAGASHTYVLQIAGGGGSVTLYSEVLDVLEIKD